MKLLLNVEKADNPVEIVIHVNVLKEGWDVNNLYTIIPLRTASSKILRKQLVGRGLRLPYGERTGEKEVDDSFKKLILAFKSAGFISSKLINSMMTMNFAYTLYLLLQSTNDVPKTEINRYIQKWFVLSVLSEDLTLLPPTLWSLTKVVRDKALRKREGGAFAPPIEKILYHHTPFSRNTHLCPGV